MTIQIKVYDLKFERFLMGSEVKKKKNFLVMFLRKKAIKRLEKVAIGRIFFEDPLGSFVFGSSKQSKPEVKIRVNDLRFYTLFAVRGALGASEAFVKNFWQTDNLIKTVQIFALNQEVLMSLEKGFLNFFSKPAMTFIKILSRNTLDQSRVNISAHYDIGNDLFKLFLDQKLMYSSAYFSHEKMNIEEAQEEKLRRICQKLNLSKSDHVLEIGSGWGGLCVYIAKNYGCRVTTTTISKEQFDYTLKLIKKEGLSSQITLLQKDYRELEGVFDRVVSVEMIEAVGADYLDDFMAVCSKRLKATGTAVIQAITINDQRYDQALKEVDFIKRYIFPGSFIPSVHAILNSSKKATDLGLYHLEDIGPHYSLTLKRWRDRFLEKKEEILKLGFDSSFIRLWDYYFCYCIGGFEERSISNVQLVFSKPFYRGDLSKNCVWQGGEV